MFTRVTLTSPSGNMKTRFQFGQCASKHPVNVIGRVCAYAVANGHSVTITYAKNFMNNRSALEINRVNAILQQIDDQLAIEKISA